MFKAPQFSCSRPSFGFLIIVFALFQFGCQTEKEGVKALPFKIEQAWSAKINDGEIVQPWLDEFNIPELNKAVQEALKSNPSLLSTVARVEEQWALTRQQKSLQWPSLSWSTQYQKRRNNIGDPPIQSTYSEQFQANALLRWEIDVWRKLNRRTRISQLNALQAEQLLESAKRSLIARLSQQWIVAASRQIQWDCSKEKVQIQSLLLESFEEEYRAGTLGLDQVLNRKSEWLQLQVSMNEKGEAFKQSNREFLAIQGKYPKDLIEVHYFWPQQIKPIRAGLPVGLLKRRPDVQQAELKWRASQHEWSIAKKERFPNFTITTNTGTLSDDFKRLFDIDYLIWSLVGEFSAPIWNFGKIRAQIEAADQRSKQAFYEYVDSILQALLEVEGVLSKEIHLRTSLEEIEKAYQLKLESFQAIQEEFKLGLKSFRQFKESELALIQTKESHIQAIERFWLNRIQIYLALGGQALNES